MDGVLLVRYKVDFKHTNAFEIWKEKMESVIHTFEGYKNTIELYAREQNNYYYAILRFDSTENAEKWMLSDYRKVMLEDSQVIWMSSKEEEIHDWETFWYSKLRKTKKWKQWLATLMAVYPLTIVIPLFVSKFSKVIPFYFMKGIIIAILNSLFMAFLMMPFIMKRLNKWLYN